MSGFDACAYAVTLHRDQVDKVGRAYVWHVWDVACAVSQAGGTPTQIQAAWLHDSIEDTDATAESLLAAGVANEVVDLVVVLTHPKGEPYADYIDRVKACPDAVTIKLADINDNLDADRLAKLDDATRDKLVKKYEDAKARLLG